MNSIYYSMRLNETRTNLPGADLDRAATPQGCAPGTAHIRNLAANPGRSPLMRNYGYASSDDRPAFADRDVGVRATQRSGVPEQLAEFARFPLVFVPFMQYAG